MDIQRFKLVKKMYLENGDINESEISSEELRSVKEFFQTKLEAEESLNEGFLHSIVSWFKRNYSSRAVKMKRLGNDYYKWLMEEFKSMYKKDKYNDTPLESFLKRETPSSDIEQQIKDIARDDVDYQELAKKVILENRIKAKKTFCQSQLGANDPLTKKYEEEEIGAAKDRTRMMAKMSRKDAGKFGYNFSELKDYIVKDGRDPHIASILASGISIFAQNRKLRNGTDFDAESMKKMYDEGEGELIRKNKDYDNIEGAEYMSSVRCAKTAELLGMEKMTADDLERAVQKIQTTLTDFLQEFKQELRDHWGIVQLYLMQRTQQAQKEVLNKLREEMKDMSDKDMDDFSDKIETELEDIDDKHLDADSEEAAVDNLETKLKKIRADVATQNGSEDKPEEEVKDTPPEATPASTEEPASGDSEKEMPSTETPAEDEDDDGSEHGPQGEKLIEATKARPVHLLDGIRDYVFAVSTATLKGEKYVWNPIAKKTYTAIHSGLNHATTGIPKELVQQALKYLSPSNPDLVKSRNDDEIIGFKSSPTAKPIFNDDMIKKAAKALFDDYSLGLHVWKKDVEKADEDTLRELVSLDFFATLFRDKGGSEEPLDKEKVQELMGKTFTDFV